jgi:type II secretory pathway pseudopilin PulG
VQRVGFSLIELLVSSSIIMLLILGTSQALLYAILVKSRVRAQITATELAKAKLEYFKSLAFESLELQPNSWEEIISQPNIPLRYQLKGKITNESNRMKRIEIECNSALHPQKSTRIALLISRQLGF